MNQPQTPNGFYRVSIKALILDPTRTKFAIVREDNGWWELPGGGLDHGETPEQGLKRELKEEMGLTVTEVAKFPSYFMVGKNMKGNWSVNLVYEVKVKDLNFIPSEECQELKFVSPNEIGNFHAFRTVVEMAAQFAPEKHI